MFDEDFISQEILSNGVAQLVARLTRNVEVVGSSYSKAPVVFFGKKLYTCCLVLVGSMNGFERDFIIELK